MTLWIFAGNVAIWSFNAAMYDGALSFVSALLAGFFFSMILSAAFAAARLAEHERLWADWWAEQYRCLRDGIDETDVRVSYVGHDPAQFYDRYQG